MRAVVDHLRGVELVEHDARPRHPPLCGTPVGREAVDHDALDARPYRRAHQGEAQFGSGLAAIFHEFEHLATLGIGEHGVIAEHAPKSALIEIDDARKLPRWAGQFIASARIESLDDSVARYLLRRSDPRERLVNRSLEQTLSKPRRDRSSRGYLWVALPAGAPAVPAPEPPLVPQQHGRIAARPVADASEVALVTGDIEGPAVEARGDSDRSHLDLEPSVDDLRIDDPKPVRSSGTRIASTEGPPFFDGLVNEEAKEASLQFS